MVYRPWKSHVPDAMRSFAAALRVEAKTWDGVQPVIHYGPFVGGGTDDATIVVGWTGFAPGYQYATRTMSEELYTAAVSQQSTQVGLTPSVMEEFLINCASLVRSGGTGEDDIDESVVTAYANLEIAGNVLQGPQWLSGNVARAEMAESAGLNLVQDRRGLLALVTFAVRCTAWAQQ